MMGRVWGRILVLCGFFRFMVCVCISKGPTTVGTSMGWDMKDGRGGALCVSQVEDMEDRE